MGVHHREGVINFIYSSALEPVGKQLSGWWAELHTSATRTSSHLAKVTTTLFEHKLLYYVLILSFSSLMCMWWWWVYLFVYLFLFRLSMLNLWGRRGHASSLFSPPSFSSVCVPVTYSCWYIHIVCRHTENMENIYIYSGHSSSTRSVQQLYSSVSSYLQLI